MLQALAQSYLAQPYLAHAACRDRACAAVHVLGRRGRITGAQQRNKSNEM